MVETTISILMNIYKRHMNLYREYVQNLFVSLWVIKVSVLQPLLWKVERIWISYFSRWAMWKISPFGYKSWSCFYSLSDLIGKCSVVVTDFSNFSAWNIALFICHWNFKDCSIVQLTMKFQRMSVSCAWCKGSIW